MFVCDIYGGTCLSFDKCDRVYTSNRIWQRGMSVFIGRVSIERENEAVCRKSIFSMITYRTMFCFGL